jgi:hypothetical protein
VSSIQIGDKTLTVAGSPIVEAPAGLPPEKPAPPAVDPGVGHFPRLLSIEADGPTE